MFGIDAKFHRRARFRLLGRLMHTLAVVVTAWLAAPTAARAQAIDYAFSNATAVLDGTPYSITGAFTVYSPLNEVFFAQIDITGSGPLASAGGRCNNLTCGSFQNDLLQLGPSFQIQFSSGASPNSLALTSVEIGGFTDNAPTGVATPNGGPLTYSFVNAFTVLNGDIESITGHFGFDPLSDIEYAADIHLTGPAPYAANYFFDIELEGPNFIYADRGGAFLKISFANDLSFCADPLTGTAYEDGPDSVGIAPASGFVAGGVCAVPEPTSIALLGAAFGLLLLGLPIGGVRPSRLWHPD